MSDSHTDYHAMPLDRLIPNQLQKKDVANIQFLWTQLQLLQLLVYLVRLLLVTTGCGVLFFKPVYFLEWRTRNFGLFWPVLSILLRIYALFVVLFTSLNSAAVYQNWQISGISLPDSLVTLWETLDLSLCEYVCVTMINGDLPFRHGATCPLAPPLLCATPQEANAIWLNPNLPPIGFSLEFKTNLTLPVARTRAKKLTLSSPECCTTSWPTTMCPRTSKID